MGIAVVKKEYMSREPANSHGPPRRATRKHQIRRQEEERGAHGPEPSLGFSQEGVDEAGQVVWANLAF